VLSNHIRSVPAFDKQSATVSYLIICALILFTLMIIIQYLYSAMESEDTEALKDTEAVLLCLVIMLTIHSNLISF